MTSIKCRHFFTEDASLDPSQIQNRLGWYVLQLNLVSEGEKLTRRIALGKLLSNATIDQVDGHYTAEQTQKFIDDPEYYYRIVRGSDATLSKNLMSVLKKGSPGQVAIRQATLEYMQNTIRDPKLREALIPTFELNCRRVAPNDDYLEALQHPNASVITKPIKAFTENGLELEDGSTPEYDIIVRTASSDIGIDDLLIIRFQRYVRQVMTIVRTQHHSAPVSLRLCRTIS